MDHEIGRMVDALERTGSLEDTLILLTLTLHGNRMPWVIGGTFDFDKDVWELYKLNEDPTEIRNIATASEPFDVGIDNGGSVDRKAYTSPNKFSDMLNWVRFDLQ